MIRVPKSVPNAGELFVCCKTSAPIPVDSALARQALILAALDGSVLSIHAAQKPAIAILHRVRGISALILNSGSRQAPPPRLDTEIKVEFITASEIGAEPRFSNAIGIWSTRHRQVAMADRVRVLAHLDEDGAVPLIELARSIISATDAVATIFALACGGLVAIEIESEPIGPETLVRRVAKRI